MSCPYRRTDSNTGFKKQIYIVNQMQTSYIFRSEVFGQTKCNFKSNSSFDMFMKIFCNQRIWSWRFSDCEVLPAVVLWYEISWPPDPFPQSRLVSMFWSVVLIILSFYSDDLMFCPSIEDILLTALIFILLSVHLFFFVSLFTALLW